MRGAGAAGACACVILRDAYGVKQQLLPPYRHRLLIGSTVAEKCGFESRRGYVR